MSPLTDALRRKFKTPQAALAALGLDAALLTDTSSTEKEPTMPTKPLTRTAARVHAALCAHLLPKIALDSHLKASTALAAGLIGIDHKNFKDSRPAILKLANDAEPMMTPEAKKAGVGPDDVIMKLVEHVVGTGEAADEPEEDPAAKPASPWRQKAMDYFKAKGMDEKGAAEACDALDPGIEAAEDEDDEGAEEKAKREKEDKAKAEKAMDETIKIAVDKQVAASVTAAVESERKRSKDAAEARQFVEPWVGKVSLAHDSAEDIYRTTLGMLGVKHEAVKEGAALKILVEAQPKPHERNQNRATFAADSAPEGKAFTDMFPGAERIGHAA